MLNSGGPAAGAVTHGSGSVSELSLGTGQCTLIRLEHSDDSASSGYLVNQEGAPKRQIRTKHCTAAQANTMHGKQHHSCGLFTWVAPLLHVLWPGQTYLRTAAIPWGWIFRVAALITVVPVTTAARRAGPLTPVVMTVVVSVAPVVPVPAAAAAAPVVPAAAPVITVPVAFPVPAAAPLTLTVSAAAPLCCCYLSAARPATIRQCPTSQAILPLLDDLCVCLPDLLPAQVLLACQVVLQDSNRAAKQPPQQQTRRQTAQQTGRGAL